MGTDHTPNFNWPVPDADEQPNGPLQIGAFANAADADVADIRDSAFTPARPPRIVGGIILPNFGAAGNYRGVSFNFVDTPWHVDLGFQPQKVEFICNVTAASSGAVAAINVGGMMFDPDGNFIQFLTGARVAGSTDERRFVTTKCAGVIIDDTTIQASCSGTITPTGFTLNASSTESGISFAFTAWQ